MGQGFKLDFGVNHLIMILMLHLQQGNDSNSDNKYIHRRDAVQQMPNRPDSCQQ